MGFLTGKVRNKINQVTMSFQSREVIPSAPAVNPGKPTARMLYQSRFNEGCNFGSQFVLEKWISDKLFADTSSGSSELEAVKSCVSRHGVEEARRRFEEHWRNWIVNSDWDWLVSKGVKGVRVPIGFWMVCSGAFTVGTPFEAYKEVYQNTWTIFKQAILDKAVERQIAVLVDIHAVPGGANGEAHSGTNSGKAEFWTNSAYQNLALQCLQFLARDLKGYDNISGIAVLNEGVYDWQGTAQKDYYARAIRAVREVVNDVPIVVSDCWDLSQYINWVKSKETATGGNGSLGVVLDEHQYRCFSDSDRAKSPRQLIDSVNSALPDQHDVDVLIGEYSCVLDTQSWNKLAPGESRDQLVKEYGQRQTEFYSKRASAGNYFWTYKFEHGSGGEWGFRDMVEKGALPVRRNSPACMPQDYQQRLDRCSNEHESYWKRVDPNRDWQCWRYRDGFEKGWQDAQSFYEFGASRLGRFAAWFHAREAQHIQQHGNSDMVWSFRHGFERGLQEFESAVPY